MTTHRPASLPPATPDDLAQSRRIIEAAGYVVCVVGGVLGGWDLHARNGRDITLVVAARGPGDPPGLLGIQYLGPTGWPSGVLRLLHWYRGDATWPEARLL